MHKIIFKSSSTYQVDGVDRHYAMGYMVTDTVASQDGGWFGTIVYTKRYLDRPLTYAIFMNQDTLFWSGLFQKVDSLINQNI